MVMLLTDFIVRPWILLTKVDRDKKNYFLYYKFTYYNTYN
jgi:hypothetical protein